ncbi:MAG: polysaccharide biosynthesis C-terminal domain-containing protein [Clostridia bacterium]|nr:polysaccharide biosynthesis C-terminal domain-containing protein [Clostridia bacterium]
MNSSKQIKFGAMMSYFAIVVNIVAGLVYTPWMITKIGQGNYGLYTIASSLITLFVMDFGMSAAVGRFVSLYVAKGEQNKANDFMGLVYKLYMALDAIIFVALVVAYFLIETIYKNLTPDEIHTLKGLYIIVAIYSLVQFPFMNLNGILTAYEKFVQLKACDLFHKVFIIFSVVAALLLGFGVEALVTANAVSGILTILLKLLVIRRRTAMRANFRFFDKSLLKDIFGFSIWTTVTALMQRMIFNITPTIIAAVSATGSVGTAIFGLASTIEGYVYTFATAINGMFMPRISKIVVSGKKEEELLPLMVKIGRLQLIITGLITVGFITFGRTFVIDIWNKPDFADTYICAVLLIVPSMFYLPMQIANTTLIVENKVRWQAVIFIITGAANIVFSLPLSKYFGAIGASASICIAYFIRNILMAVTHYKVLKIDMPAFFKQVYLKLMPQLILASALGFLCQRFNPVTNRYLSFLINGAVFVLFYFAIMWVKGFNEYEKDLALGVFRKLTRKLKKGRS